MHATQGIWYTRTSSRWHMEALLSVQQNSRYQLNVIYIALPFTHTIGYHGLLWSTLCWNSSRTAHCLCHCLAMDFISNFKAKSRGQLTCEKTTCLEPRCWLCEEERVRLVQTNEREHRCASEPERNPHPNTQEINSEASLITHTHTATHTHISVFYWYGENRTVSFSIGALGHSQIGN